MSLRYGYLTVVFLFWLLVGPIPAAADPNTRILIIHSYSQEYPWTRGEHMGFVAALREGHSGEVVIETEYLDTKRISLTPEYISTFTDYLKVKYREFKPTAIYVTDDNALGFTTRQLS
ncbi:MAG: hypothetical protein AB2541_08345, partial [Candidatus Thiodiazotropha sp.]